MEHKTIKDAMAAGASFKTEADKERYVEKHKNGTFIAMLALVIYFLIGTIFGMMAVLSVLS